MTPGTCSISVDADGTPTYNAAPQKTIHITQANSVDQGGLTWLPIYPHSKNDWTRAKVVWCSSHTIVQGSTILGKGSGPYGHDDWRLPTKEELISLAKSGALVGQGWTRDYTWSSEESGNRRGFYEKVDVGTPFLNYPNHYPEHGNKNVNFTCVRKN